MENNSNEKRILTQTEFKEFLRDNNIIHKFKKNWLRSPKNGKTVLERLNPPINIKYNLFLSAFPWASANEGSDFWGKIHNTFNTLFFPSLDEYSLTSCTTYYAPYTTYYTYANTYVTTTTLTL